MDELFPYNCVSINAEDRSLKRPTKILLAVPVVLICCVVLNEYMHQRRIKAEEKEVFRAQLTIYSTFIKPGMTRMDVEAKLREHSISFSHDGYFGYGTLHGDEFVLLKRIGSPVWYCSFEDIAARFQFGPNDRLDGIKEYGQLADCL